MAQLRPINDRWSYPLSRLLARDGPVGPVSRCLLIGVDRKWLILDGTDANDPKATSYQTLKLSNLEICSVDAILLRKQSLREGVRDRRANMKMRFVFALLIVEALVSTAASGRAVGDQSQSEASPNGSQKASDQCNEQYGALKKDLEAAAQPIRDVKQRRAPATALCGLITAYREAEIKIIEFVDANSTLCRFPQNFGEDARKAHLTTERMFAEACKKPSVPWRE